MAVNVDKTIGGLLRRLRRRIRGVDFAALAFAYIGFALLFFLVVATADRWLILDRKVRIGLLGTFGFISLCLSPVILIVLFRRINALYLARHIEKGNPGLEDGLLTYVQVVRGEATFGEELSRTIMDRVRSEIASGRVSLKPATPVRLLKVAAYFFVTAFVLFGATAVAAGDPFFVCLRRVLFPRANILPPTLTQIVEVLPGDTTTIPSVPVEIAAVIRGKDVSSVRLYYSHDEKTWLYVNMDRPAASGAGVTTSQEAWGGGDDRWAARLPLIEKSAGYFVAAGDTRSDQYRVEVIPPPAVLARKAHLVPPKYSGFGGKETSGGNVDALCGTEVVVTASANRPMRKCSMVRGGEPPMPLKMNPQNETSVTFTVDQTESYRFLCEDEYGFKNENPCQYDVLARSDAAPEVGIMSPGSVEVRQNEPFTLLVTASDDCGLKDLSLVFRIKDRAGNRWNLPFKSVKPAPTRSTTVEREVYPAELGLRAGDTMLYFVEARDTCEPASNLGTSELCILKVLPPLQSSAVQPGGPGDDPANRDGTGQGMPLSSLASLKEMLDALRTGSPGLFAPQADGVPPSPLTPWELERLERLQEELADEEGSDEEGDDEGDYDDLLADEDEEECECGGA
ncbi:MAG: hypothetical protein RDV41_00200 [Planctomycetota bacterium]|nr:hypothetical protein [Planctomycetota bacterium]